MMNNERRETRNQNPGIRGKCRNAKDLQEKSIFKRENMPIRKRRGYQEKHPNATTLALRS